MALAIFPPGVLFAEEFVLVDEGQEVAVLTPDGEAAGEGWKGVGPLSAPESWLAGQSGVGFDRGEPFLPHFNLDVQEQMRGISSSAYIRMSFHMDGKLFSRLTKLTLGMKYDDGFAAYLNGRLIASANAPLEDDGQSVSWNASATATHNDRLAVEFETFDLDASVVLLLKPGENILAIHGLNSSAGGADFLISPRLIGEDVFVPVWPNVHVREVARASSPTVIVHPGDGSDRLFIVEQAGRIRVLENGELREFMRISSQIRSGGEQGLLGLAFPPGFPGEGKDRFYVNYTRRRPTNDGATVVSRFHLDDGPEVTEQIGDPDSEEVLLVVEQPFTNHNGGDMHFGRDGFLYIGFGDGGAGGDPGNRAQDPDELLGKMLRIDVEGEPDPGLPYAIPPSNPFVAEAGIRPEIWATGLRNPWRWSFDRVTGEMYIGDVGQNDYEEISYEPAGSSGGLNFGWRRKEGFHDFNRGTPLEAGTETEPIIEVNQRRGDRSITGGFVYRGSRFPGMQGIYVFADYASGRIFGAQRDDEGTWLTEELARPRLGISAFGEDLNGELFLADYDGGRIYELRDDRDGTYLQVTDSGYDSITGAFSLTFGGAIGETYQAEVSEDLLNWERAGPRVTVTEDNAYAVTLTLDGAVLADKRDLYVKGTKIL